MSVVLDIVSTYRRPKSTLHRLVSSGVSDPRVLTYLMLSCGLMFLAQLPRLSREATFDPSKGFEICESQGTPAASCDAHGEALMALAGGALMGWVFLAPLLFYALAWISSGVLRVLTGQSQGLQARLSLFWALLAAAPLLLLQGLVLGFIGKGLQSDLMGLLWLAALVCFWFCGLRATYGVARG